MWDREERLLCLHVQVSVCVWMVWVTECMCVKMWRDLTRKLDCNCNKHDCLDRKRGWKERGESLKRTGKAEHAAGLAPPHEALKDRNNKTKRLTKHAVTLGAGPQHLALRSLDSSFFFFFFFSYTHSWISSLSCVPCGRRRKNIRQYSPSPPPHLIEASTSSSSSRSFTTDTLSRPPTPWPPARPRTRRPHQEGYKKAVSTYSA